MGKYNSSFKAKIGFLDRVVRKKELIKMDKTCHRKGGVPQDHIFNNWACFWVFFFCLFSVLSPYQGRTKAA